jgi:hypothetical protein
MGVVGCGDSSNGSNNLGSNNGDGNNGGGVYERSGTIEQDVSWSGTNIIENGLEVNAVVTLEACTTLEIGSGAIIHIRNGGAIVANGTADCPVTFTSSQSTPVAGDWERFDLWSSSSNETSFTHTIFEYGGDGDTTWGMLWIEDGARAAMSDVTFRHSPGRAAYFEPGAEIVDFTNVSFENLGREALHIGANEVGSLSPVTAGDDVLPIEVVNATLTDDQTWQALGLPYLLSGGLEINAELQVAAGVELLMGSTSVVQVRTGGAVVTNGEDGNPVVIKSAKSSPAAGDWSRFDIWASTSNNNSFTWTEIMHGGSDTVFGAVWVEDGASLSLNDVTFADNDGCDVYDEGSVDATNSDYGSCL